MLVLVLVFVVMVLVVKFLVPIVALKVGNGGGSVDSCCNVVIGFIVRVNYIKV